VDQVGPYTVLSELARGGMGVVYRARHAQLGRDVAVKVLRAGKDASELQRRRFETEARTLARLRHPNIVAVHDVGEERGVPYLVMDLVEGESLEARLLRDGPLLPGEAARVTAALARALQHAHDAQVLHRDVKPANVLLARDGTPLLTDFGLAKDLDGSRLGMSVSGRFMGTPGFMPPEQAKGELDRVGPRSDLFALGATFYAMLTAAPPFDGASLSDVMLATLEHPVVAPSARRAQDGHPPLDRDLDLICLRCLEKDPAARYGSAAEVAELLERYGRRQSRADIAAPRPRAKQEAAGRGPRGALLAAAALTWLVSLSAALGLYARERGRAAVAEADAELHRAAVADARARAADADARAARAQEEAAAQAATMRSLREQLVVLGQALAAARGPDADPLHPPELALPAAPATAAARTLVDEARARLGRDPPDAVGAEAALGRALEADPRLGEALHLRGQVRLGLGLARGAAEDATRALALAPTVSGLWALRAEARGDLGDLRGLLDDATRALELDPSDDRARLLRGWGRSARGDPHGAIADLERVIERTQDDGLAATAYNNRGIARVSLGRLREAVADFARAAELWPGYGLPLKNSAMTRALDADLAGAQDDFARAAEADPQDPEPWLWAYGLGGDASVLTRALTSRDFLGRVAQTYAGRLPAEALLAEADAPDDPAERAERRCLAHGFLGLLAERDRDLERAHERYQACVDTGVSSCTVSYWAAARLRRLGR
jgi:tetratricopeptide (TPR) repeat protein